MADESDTSANGDRTAGPDTTPDDRPVLKRVPRIGVWAWSFVGVIAATIIVVAALAAVSEIVLPLMFAAVLAVIFKPAVEILVHHKFKPAIAAGLVVVGLIALMTGVVVATVRGVTGQTDQIGASVDAALHKAVDALGIDQASLDAARAAVEKASPAISGGFLTNLVSGIDTLIGLASGLILGAMIMYYLLKDGTRFRRSHRRTVRPRAARRHRRPHRRLQPDPPRLRAGPHRHVRHRGGGHRPRQPPARPPARVHHHRGQLRRRLHPLHRRLSRWRAGRDRRPRRRRTRRGRRHARGGARREPDAGELHRAQGHGPHASTSTR